jgi:ribosomal protein S18 acetylase RimI-like enzyme
MGAEPVDALVRDATPNDAAAVARIGQAAFTDLHRGLLADIVIEAVVAQTYSVDALTGCISRCAQAPDAHFLVAERESEIVGYLHFDSEGDEPELHRIYVEPNRKRGGIGTTLLREHHHRLGPGGSYILLVLAANEGAIAFYGRHGLVEEAHVDAVAFYREHMAVEFPPDASPVPALVLRYTAPA